MSSKPAFAVLDEIPDWLVEPSRRGCGGCGGCSEGGCGIRDRVVIERLEGDEDENPRDLEQSRRRSSGDQPSTSVRYGYMRYVAEFTHMPDMKFTRSAKLIIQTRRGIEIGEQVMLTCNGCDAAVDHQLKSQWIEVNGEASYSFDGGRILREATAADLAEYARIQSFAKERVIFCQRLAEQMDLPIRVVECETIFGGERIIFYFTAESRVDFRAVVKELAREYRTRIELRQVGARDEARLLADFETCGQEVCCKTFLKTLKPITMKMAKMQKATLDPSKVSGRCGRLKCCLRYEHETYEELDTKLPKLGARILTPHGEGGVVARQVLTQLVQIRAGDGSVYTVPEEFIGVSPEEAAERIRETPQTTSQSSEEQPEPVEERAQQHRRGRGRSRRSSNRRSDSSRDTGQVDEQGRSQPPNENKEKRRPRSRRRRPRRRSGGEDSQQSG